MLHPKIASLIGSWMFVGVIDGATSSLIGSVMVFVLGGIGLCVNYFMNRANNAARRQEARDQTEAILASVRLTNNQLELARIAAEEAARTVVVKAAEVKDELTHATNQQTTAIVTKVEEVKHEAGRAYIAANGNQEKFLEVVDKLSHVQDQAITNTFAIKDLKAAAKRVGKVGRRATDQKAAEQSAVIAPTSVDQSSKSSEPPHGE